MSGYLHRGCGMESNEINITYETLFEVLKREKDTSDMQRLETGFFNNFVDYLNEKKRLMEKDDTLFSNEKKKKVDRQIDNAKRLVKELYERREKKVMEIALIKSRTKSDVMDKSSFLEHEKGLFNELVDILDRLRNNVANNIISGNYPNGAVATNMTDDAKREIVERSAQPQNDTKLVRFLHPVLKFVGKELEEYGPFEEEHIANLPSEIAELLIEKGKVEEITSQ